MLVLKTRKLFVSRDKKRRQGRPVKRWREDLDKYWSDTPNHGTLWLPNDDDHGSVSLTRDVNEDFRRPVSSMTE